MDCICEPQIPLNDECVRLSNILKGMFFGYIILLIAIIIIGNLNSILGYVFAMSLILWGSLQCKSNLVAMSIYFTIFNLFIDVFYICKMVQNYCLDLKSQYTDNNGLLIAAFVVESVCIIYQSVLIYFLFRSYKEFKFLYKANAYSTFFT